MQYYHFSQKNMLSSKKINMQEGFSIQFSNQKNSGHTKLRTIQFFFLAGSTCSKAEFSRPTEPRNSHSLFQTIFEPTLMLGLGSMAIECPLDKDIPSRIRTLPHFLSFFFFLFFFPSSLLYSTSTLPNIFFHQTELVWSRTPPSKLV